MMAAYLGQTGKMHERGRAGKVREMVFDKREEKYSGISYIYLKLKACACSSRGKKSRKLKWHVVGWK